MKETFKAVSVKTATGLQVESTVRDFKFIMDEPAGLGGTDTGMNPVEAVLCALGSCQSIVVAAFAKAMDFTYESFRVELEGDLDPDGFTHKNENVRPGFQEIRFKFIFKTNEPMEKVEKFAEFVETTCPVGDMLKNGVPLVKEVVVE